MLSHLRIIQCVLLPSGYPVMNFTWKDIQNDTFVNQRGQSHKTGRETNNFKKWLLW